MSRIDAIRRFNRFYTRRIGALQPHYLGAPYSLPQARVLYELGQRGEATASELGADLDLDLGYLSRLLQGLRRSGLVQGQASPTDARRVRLSLTPRGRKAYQQLDARSKEEVATMLGKLGAPQQARLVGALKTVESVLGAAKGEIALRPHRPGDMGWVIHAHGRLYYEEYGWDERFEALVAGIAADFVKNLKKDRERCWIAEVDGDPVGSAFVVQESKTVAKLRLLIVEPRARGKGLGRRLVEECIAFARAKGYRKLVLWTQSNLAAARHIYKSCGFRLAKRQRHREFGVPLTGEYWAMSFSDDSGASVARIPGAVEKSRKQRLLKQAVERFGKERVAASLRVPVHLLDAWLQGHGSMPDRKVLQLADLLDSSIP